jgi:CAAX protease family protein
MNSFAAALRGFGPIGILAIVLILFGNVLGSPLSAVLVLVWVVLSQTPWAAIAYAAPRNWLASTAIGLSFGVALKLVMKTLVMPLFGAPAINPAYHYLAGNREAALLFVPAVIVVAGFGEETLYRGWMFERLGRFVRSKAAIVILTSLVFGAAHYAVQGVAGVEQATIVGLILGSMVASTGRIWTAMCAHAAFDITAIAIIYWNLEEPVAHLIFR